MHTNTVYGIQQAVDSMLRKVNEIDAELNPLINNSEKDYLQIGSSLYSIADQAGKLSEFSMNCSELLMGDATLDIINNLRTRFKNLDTYFVFSIKKIEKDKEFLELVLQEFRKIDSPFKSFKKIVKHLNMLSVSIRVESARLTSERNTFSVLADDVLKLAKRAEGILNDITQFIAEIYESMEKLFDSIDELKNNKYLITRSKLQPIKNVLDKFWKEQEKYSDVSKNISNHMLKTQSDISQIVTSLQSQDIVKQNLQHVSEALQGQIINEYNNVENDLEGFVSKTSVVLNLQLNQIKEAEKSITNSIASVRNNLFEIRTNSDGIENEVGHIVNVCQNTGKNVISNSENKMLEITTSLSETVNTHNLIISRIHSTLALVDQIAQTLKNVDELDITIKILTYNGLIHATRIGNEGAALRVIADSIQTLSTDSQKQVKKFNVIIDAVKEHANAVKLKKEEDEAETAQNVIDGISNELKDFFDKLIGINLQMSKNNMEYNRTIAAFQKNIADTIDGIKIDMIFSKKANDIITKISDINRELMPYQKNQRKEEILKELSVLQSSYTMDSERDIHNKTLNNKYESVASVVEDNDDNIELF